MSKDPWISFFLAFWWISLNIPGCSFVAETTRNQMKSCQGAQDIPEALLKIILIMFYRPLLLRIDFKIGLQYDLFSFKHKISLLTEINIPAIFWACHLLIHLFLFLQFFSFWELYCLQIYLHSWMSAISYFLITSYHPYLTFWKIYSSIDL